MKHSESINEIAAALAKAQAVIAGAVKDSVNPHEESAMFYAYARRAERSGWQHSKSPLMHRLMNRVVFGLSDCWHFCGARNQFGYGRLTVNNRLQVAHRLSYQTFIGPIPPGMFVLHRCDNPSCINPDHLWLGTYSDNRRDCVAKGRANMPRGDKHYMRRSQ